MLEQAPELDMLVVPIGGGGLIAGMAIAAKALKPGIEVIGVEIDGLLPRCTSACTATAGDGGRRHHRRGHRGQRRRRAAAARSVARAGRRSRRWSTRTRSKRAIALLIEIEKTVAEGAGAAGLAALLAHPQRFAGRQASASSLCGGNIDTRLLASVLMRGLVRDGRHGAPARRRCPTRRAASPRVADA